jgi:hypothetical protein
MACSTGRSSYPGLIRFSSSSLERVQSSVPCTVLEREGRWLRIEAPTEIPFGCTVAVDYGDLCCVGEILECVPHGAGTWMAVMAMEQTITSTESLMQLQAAIQNSRPQPVSEPTRMFGAV